MKQDCQIRAMTAADVADIACIESATSPHPWREPQFMESLQHHHCYVMSKDGVVIGFMIFTLIGPESEIMNIAISPDYQGKGYGRSLLDYLIGSVSKTAQRLFLEVRVSNFSAIRLYQSAGFSELCVRQGYYQTACGREDALMMALDLQLDPSELTKTTEIV